MLSMAGVSEYLHAAPRGCLFKSSKKPPMSLESGPWGGRGKMKKLSITSMETRASLNII